MYNDYITISKYMIFFNVFSILRGGDPEKKLSGKTFQFVMIVFKCCVGAFLKRNLIFYL